jgi:F-type H+-transporting ATPase subunit gamma
METLESFRRRITVATEMQSVVRTMKTLAAVNIRQYEAAVAALAEFNRTLRLGFQILLRDQSTEIRTPKKSNKFGAIVFGSDQGMCGQFNEQIADYTRDYIRSRTAAAEDWSLLAIGARVQARLADAQIPIDSTAELPGSLAGITLLVQHLLPRLEQWQNSGNLARVYIFYNRRLSPSTYAARHFRMLPPDLKTLARTRADESGFRTLPVFSMQRQALLRALLRQYLFVSLYRSCAESLASENASRIAAMQAAEKNIEDKLLELTQDFNRYRQTAITEETLDLIGGYEALRSKEEESKRKKG